MISCVVLSAGESLRFGSPKALADIRGKCALAHIQDNLLNAAIDEIIIVLGAHADAIKPHVFNHKKVKLVYNKNYKFGQTSSFQAGVMSVDKKSRGIFMIPVDCPFILNTTYQHLREQFYQHMPDILIPSYKGKKGHPPAFNINLKKTILTLSLNQGVNALFKNHDIKIVDVTDPGTIQTFNTKEELQQLFEMDKLI